MKLEATHFMARLLRLLKSWQRTRFEVDCYELMM